MEAGEEEVRVRDARSGSSRDFFLLRRERCTLWEAEEGLGLVWRTGEWAMRGAGELTRGLGVCGLEDVLPMLGGWRGQYEGGDGGQNANQADDWVGSATGAVEKRGRGARSRQAHKRGTPLRQDRLQTPAAARGRFSLQPKGEGTSQRPQSVPLHSAHTNRGDAHLRSC